jgi:uroporphyrin-III C-methyltransferase
MAEATNAAMVSLVGAGCGAADLITVRGLRRLRNADAVLHDALISPELLEEIRPDAVRLYVGKRGYCVGSTQQETIHEALIRLAREGKTVCRLKCGDPCLFGRGGEEAEALAEAGIPFEIIPGVSAAFGAAAEASIPLTHRAVGQSITFATGHFHPDSQDCTLDWPALARAPVVVFYMATRYIAEIAAKLIEQGASPNTAVAILENGTLANQRETIGELWNIAALNTDVQAPAVLVIGEVIRHRPQRNALLSQFATAEVPE